MNSDAKEEAILPKKIVDSETEAIRLESFDKLISLMEAYYSADADNVHEAEKFYRELATRFIRRLPQDYIEVRVASDCLSKRVSKLEKIWDKFLIEELATPYGELFAEARLSIPHTNPIFTDPLVLHFPLFSQRKIMAILERTYPQVFSLLVCCKPGAIFKYEALRDPNHTRSEVVDRYYQILADAFNDYVSSLPKERLAYALKDFLESVKSPYKDFIEMGTYLECREIEGKRVSTVLLELQIEQVLRRYKLRPEQYQLISGPQGEPLGSAFTLGSLERLSLLWARDQSEEFFNKLPRKLLPALKRLDESLYEDLLRAINGDLNNALEKCELEGATPVVEALKAISSERLEFPDLQRSKFLYQELDRVSIELAKEEDEQKCKELEAKLIDIRLELYEFLNKERENFVLDCEREDQLLYDLSQRKVAMPWEEKQIEREMMMIDHALKEHRTKLNSLDARIKSLDGMFEVLSERVDIRVKEITDDLRSKPYIPRKLSGNVIQRAKLDHALQALFTLADSLLPSIREKLSISSFIEHGVEDPISASSFCVADPFSRFSRELKEELSVHGDKELKKRKPYLAEHIDMLSILDACSAGMSPKRLRKKFPAHLVDVHVLRQRKAKDKLEVSQLKELFPHLKTLINLIAGREKLDAKFKQDSANVVYCYERLLVECTPIWASESLSSEQQYLLKNTALSLVWEWYVRLVDNPYSLESKDKQEAFSLWYEHELAKNIRENHTELYPQLIVQKPGVVFPLEEIEFFNWQETPARSEYLRVLADEVIEQLKGFSGKNLLLRYKAFLESVTAPFGEFYFHSAYDLDGFVNKLLCISVPQRRLFSSEARKGIVEDWIKNNELTFYGNEEHAGKLALLLVDEIKEQDSLLRNRLVFEMLQEDIKAKRSYRDEVFVELKRLPAVAQELHQESISGLNAEIYKLDNILSLLEKDIAAAEAPSVT